MWAAVAFSYSSALVSPSSSVFFGAVCVRFFADGAFLGCLTQTSRRSAGGRSSIRTPTRTRHKPPEQVEPVHHSQGRNPTRPSRSRARSAGDGNRGSPSNSAALRGPVPNGAGCWGRLGVGGCADRAGRGRDPAGLSAGTWEWAVCWWTLPSPPQGSGFPPDLDHQGQRRMKITKWITFDVLSEGLCSAVADVYNVSAGRKLNVAAKPRTLGSSAR